MGRLLGLFAFPLGSRLKTAGLGKADMTLDVGLKGTPVSLVVARELGPKRCLRWSLVVAANGTSYGDLVDGIDRYYEKLNESDEWSSLQMLTETQIRLEVGWHVLVNPG
jgi:hypothetical protein